MSSNTSVAFGAGVLVGTPAGANATPVQFGTIQEVSVDFSFSTKNLMGQFQFPVAVARGAGKISGKAKFANLDGPVLNSLFFNVPQVVGQKLWSYQEAGTIPAATPWTITVANSATFDADLGVIFAATGLPLVKVASAPAAGQYSVLAGAYAFNTGDASKAVLISYTYAPVTGGGKSVISNKLMGVAPLFQMDFYQQNPNIVGAQWSLRLYACLSSKLSMGSKLEDFIVPEFDFDAFANAANNVGEINTAI